MHVSWTPNKSWGQDNALVHGYGWSMLVVSCDDIKDVLIEVSTDRCLVIADISKPHGLNTRVGHAAADNLVGASRLSQGQLGNRKTMGWLLHDEQKHG